MKNGPYTLIIPPPTYPGKKYRNRYAYEHTVQWWLHKGVLPPVGYEIHHINGNHRDNRIENLSILSKADHKKEHGRLRRENALLELVCAFCKKNFVCLKSRAKSRSKRRKKAGLFCSISCGAKNQHKDAGKQTG